MNIKPRSVSSPAVLFLIPKKPKLINDIINLLVSKLLAKTTETSAWNPIRSKMKLFKEVINGVKAVTHKLHKENASIF